MRTGEVAESGIAPTLLSTHRSALLVQELAVVVVVVEEAAAVYLEQVVVLLHKTERRTRSRHFKRWAKLLGEPRQAVELKVSVASHLSAICRGVGLLFFGGMLSAGCAKGEGQRAHKTGRQVRR